MSTEICKKCEDESTPWKWKEELGGHICFDCHMDEVEEENNKNSLIRDDPSVELNIAKYLE